GHALPHLPRHGFAVAYGRERVVPVQLEEELHPEFGGHCPGFRNLVFVVAEDDELPGEPGKIRAILCLVGVDLADVGDHPIEIAPYAVLRVRLVARAIDGAAQVPAAILHDSVTYRVPDVVQIDGVVGGEADAARGGQFQDPRQIGVQEDLAVVGEFDLLEPWTGVQQSPEVLEAQEPGADTGMNLARRGGARRTSELAVGGCLQSDPPWIDRLTFMIPLHAGHLIRTAPAAKPRRDAQRPSSSTPASSASAAGSRHSSIFRSNQSAWTSVTATGIRSRPRHCAMAVRWKPPRKR